MKRLGFFEVDSRQRAKRNENLVFTPRTVRLRDKLEHLQSLAEKYGAPFVFTICCAERFVSKEDSVGTLVVPRDPAETDWMKELPTRRLINLEKKPAWGDYKKDDEDIVWDMFLHNDNANKLFEKLGIPHWIAYGVGIELCVNSAVRGLLKAGYQVTILSDVLRPNAQGTPKTKAQALEQLCAMGATTQTYDEFVANL